MSQKAIASRLSPASRIGLANPGPSIVMWWKSIFDDASTAPTIRMVNVATTTSAMRGIRLTILIVSLSTNAVNVLAVDTPDCWLGFQACTQRHAMDQQPRDVHSRT